MTRTRRIQPLACALLAAIGVLGAVLGSAHCNGANDPSTADAAALPGDAMADSGAASETSTDAGAPDVTPFCDASVADGAVTADWPGWRRLTELDSCCIADVPIDPVAVVPPIE